MKVSLYNNILLTSNTNNDSFVVNGFECNYGNNPQFANDNIAYALSLILSKTINIAKYDDMSTYSALNALNNNSTNLTSAILAVIENMINENTSYYGVFFGDTDSEITSIMNDIKIILPSYISLKDNESGQIPGVQITYDGISVIAANDVNENLANISNTFIIDGFEPENTSSSNTNNNVNLQIATALSALLSNELNINSYNNMNTYTAAEALFNYSNDLKQAILTKIEVIYTQSNLHDSFNWKQISSRIEIILPNSISITNDQNAQISGVQLTYNGILLTSKITGSQTFNIIGFKAAKKVYSTTTLNKKI